MKLTTRGFTLVELMIVIAIIGVLAAALFPAMSGYLARGRDTARISHVGQIITAASSSFQDNNSYDQVMLTGANIGCVNSGALNQYMWGMTPTDRLGRSHCATLPGVYGAGTGTVYGSNAVAISALLESSNMGNTGWTLTSFQVGGQTMNTYGNFNKGFGSGYVIAR